jgi:hypothetical protein
MVPVVISSTRMHKTYSSIPLFPFGCCVESVSLCQSDLSRSVLSHLPLASRILHLELGNSNFRQAGVELLGPQVTIRMFNRLNLERLGFSSQVGGSPG